MQLYSLKDVKAGTFGMVMMAQNDAHMCRLLDESLLQANPTAVKYATDFELYRVGEFSETCGEVENGTRFVLPLTVLFPPKDGA